MTRLAALLLLVVVHPVAAAELPDWALGPFTRPEGAQPVITPAPASTFHCPLADADVRWEALHTFNPAAVMKDGQVHVLYRAEDDSGEMSIGRHTSRLGLAVSDDGVNFVRRAEPVLFPAVDDQRQREWPGECEDPRIATLPDGGYVATYTQWNQKRFQIGIARSDDLVQWHKLGSAFRGTAYENLRIKSAAVVHELQDGQLVAAKIDGQYWMYFGEYEVNVATSDDLLQWTPVESEPGKLLALARPRRGRFDSALTEIGPQAVKTAAGIVLIYNGKNATGEGRDPALQSGVYSCGQLLLDAADPTRLVARLDEPFLQPQLDWERTGQYGAGTTFAEGLVHHNGRWLLYYGCADSFVGVAMTESPSESPAN
ncbi:MAG: pesticidal protein Cry15Aa [Planctomycetaceae bacterium]|nr:pesticidal protein Cry15Aa [Planctomycetaceae bacterium]